MAGVLAASLLGEGVAGAQVPPPPPPPGTVPRPPLRPLGKTTSPLATPRPGVVPPRPPGAPVAPRLPPGQQIPPGARPLAPAVPPRPAAPGTSTSPFNTVGRPPAPAARRPVAPRPRTKGSLGQGPGLGTTVGFGGGENDGPDGVPPEILDGLNHFQRLWWLYAAGLVLVTVGPGMAGAILKRRRRKRAEATLSQGRARLKQLRDQITQAKKQARAELESIQQRALYDFSADTYGIAASGLVSAVSKHKDAFGAISAEANRLGEQLQALEERPNWMFWGGGGWVIMNSDHRGSFEAEAEEVSDLAESEAEEIDEYADNLKDVLDTRLEAGGVAPAPVSSGTAGMVAVVDRSHCRTCGAPVDREKMPTKCDYCGSAL
jgi:hypothetical protein